MFAQRRKCEEGEGCVSSSYGFLNPGTKAPSEKAFICCPLQCIFWEALLLHICFKRNTIYQCRGCLVSNTFRLQSESPWSNGNSLSIHVNLFYEAHRPPLPMGISQLRLLIYVWNVKKSSMHGRKRRFLKLRPAMVNACIFLSSSWIKFLISDWATHKRQ